MNRNQNGLTLIELVMVICFIVILSMMARPLMPDLKLSFDTVSLDSKEKELLLSWTKKVDDKDKTDPENKWPRLDVFGYISGSGGTPTGLVPYAEYEWPSVGLIMMSNTPPFLDSGYYECSDTTVPGRVRYDYVTTSIFITTRVETNNQTRFALATEPTPFCRIRLYAYSPTGMWGMPSNPSDAAGLLATYGLVWSSTVDESGVIRHPPNPVPEHYMAGNLPSGAYAFTPQNARLTCTPYNALYSRTYQLTGVITTSAALPNPDGLPIGSKVYTPWNQASPVSPGKCDVVGAVEPPSPATQGTWPLATDFSGYCLIAGKKVATYKDAGKAQPTTTYSDVVRGLGQTVMDDADHCPASLF